MMRTMKAALAPILIMTVLLTAGCPLPEAIQPAVRATAVSLNKNTTTIKIGDTDLLTASVLPVNSSNLNVTWKSNTPVVATVSAAGLVTGVAAGTATVTVTTTDGGFTAVCAITVVVAVRYNGNDASAGIAPTDATDYNPGDPVTVLGPGSLVRVDHAFSGWNTQADNGGTARAPGDIFPIGNSNITLYAQWSLLPYHTVNYTGNGASSGTAPVDPGHYNSGDTITVLGDNGLARTGQLFLGWNTAADGSGTAYTPGATFVMGSVGLILYAQWYQPTVHFETAGGSAIADAQGTEIISFPVSTRTGYALEGWYPNASLIPAQKISFPFTVTSNTTIYAHWIESTEGLAFTAVSDGYSVSVGSISPLDSSPISVTIPAYWLGLPVTEIPYYGFYPEDSPGSGTYIPYPSIIAVSLPNTLKRIGRNGLSHTRIASLIVPASVTSLGACAFEYCQSLKTLAIQATITAIPDGLCNCAIQLESISFPTGITSIGNNVFNQGQKLTTITLPSTLQTIGSQTFWGAGLTSITIPPSVTSVGLRTFNQCAALVTVTIQRSSPPSGNSTYDTFNGCTSLAHIYVPAAGLGLYTASASWNWNNNHTALFSGY
jgi:uncharacterized repeat protein (TIGR02543 family)